MIDPMKRPELKPNREMQVAMERVKESRQAKLIALTSKVQPRHPDSYREK